jgi:hypothetical protein
MICKHVRIYSSQLHSAQLNLYHIWIRSPYYFNQSHILKPTKSRDLSKTTRFKIQLWFYNVLKLPCILNTNWNKVRFSIKQKKKIIMFSNEFKFWERPPFYNCVDIVCIAPLQFWHTFRFPADTWTYMECKKVRNWTHKERVVRRSIILGGKMCSLILQGRN